MINNLSDLRRYQQEDLLQSDLEQWRWYLRFQYPIMAFQRKLRRTEYIVNCFRQSAWAPVRAFARYRLRGAGMKLGFTIPVNVFGPGLSIAHWGTIVVNPDCRVGARCRVHPGVCLGWWDGKVPMLGDDCYLGPGAKVFGDVVLGDRTKVGANAVVSRSYPEGGSVLVAPRELDVAAHVVETVTMESPIDLQPF